MFVKKARTVSRHNGEPDASDGWTPSELINDDKAVDEFLNA